MYKIIYIYYIIWINISWFARIDAAKKDENSSSWPLKNEKIY